jgi:threonine dehydrogenase-like Zn-dependent dehydrogenase
LGEVVETGAEVRSLRRGDLVVGSVRLPCADGGCLPCRAGRQDFCETGRYAERGIKELHGFLTEFVVEEERYLHRLPEELRQVGVLTEPLTIAEKSYIEFRAIETRKPWRGHRTALVVGAGPVGLLGAMLLREKGYDTWVYSCERAPGPEMRIVEAIGARYVSTADEPADRLAARMGPIDVVYEAAGAPQTSWDVLSHMGPNTVYVLTGVPRRGEQISLDPHKLSLEMVMHNQVILGTVNAGPDAFAGAIRDLGTFLARWPEATRGLITGRFPMERFWEPVTGAAGGIKSVIEIG